MKLKRVFSFALAIPALTAIVYLWSTNRGSAAASVATIVATLMMLLTLFGLFVQPPEPKDLTEILPQLTEQVRRMLQKQARDQWADRQQFLPVRLVHWEGNEQVLSKYDRKPAWRMASFQLAMASVLLRQEKRRTVILGGPGLGKTTLSLMLAAGLLKHPQGSVPLLLSVDSWDPEAEMFRNWLDRQLTISYKAIGAMGADRIDQLVSSDRILFILDGLDMLGESVTKRAVADINATIPQDRPLVALSRPLGNCTFSGLAGAGGTVLGIEPRDARAIARFLAYAARRPDGSRVWEVAAAWIAHGRLPRVAEVLRTPLYLFLAMRNYRSSDDVANFMSGVSRASQQEIKHLLIDDYLYSAIRSMGGEPGGRQWRHLLYVGHRLNEFGTTSIAWWRVSRAISDQVMTAAICLSMGPAYWLALLMPAGLTRGLALGCFTGILVGVSRNRQLWRGSGAALLACALVVGAVGLFRTTPAIAAADITQMSLSAALTVLLKNAMVVPAGDPEPRLEKLRRWAPIGPRLARLAVVAEGRTRPFLCVTAVGLVATIGVQILHATWSSAGADRTFVSVWMSASFGVGVAVLSARLLIVPVGGPIRPSRVTLRIYGGRRGNPLPHLSAATTSATAIGVAGGFVGALHGGAAYGAILTVFFGFVAGVPIGIAGGLMRWLSQPAAGPASTGPWRTFRNDWLATIGCMVLVSIASAASIALVLGGWQSLARTLGQPVLIHPVHGVLFGITIGAIVACYYNATPGYVIAICWLGLNGRLPWRFMAYLRQLQRVGLLRRVGAVYEIQHVELRDRLNTLHLGNPEANAAQNGSSAPAQPGPVSVNRTRAR